MGIKDWFSNNETFKTAKKFKDIENARKRVTLSEIEEGLNIQMHKRNSFRGMYPRQGKLTFDEDKISYEGLNIPVSLIYNVYYKSIGKSWYAYIFLKDENRFDFQINRKDKKGAYVDIVDHIKDMVKAREKVIAENPDEDLKLIEDYKMKLECKKKELIQRENDLLDKYKEGVGVEIEREFMSTVNKHGTITKVAGTAAFGLVGAAATSGVKNKKSSEYVPAILYYNNNEIIIDDLKIPYSVVTGFYYSIITNRVSIGRNNGKNISLKLTGVPIHEDERLCKALNRLCKGEITIDLDEINESMDETSTSVNELKEIMAMYEKGLLTDEEFTAMKKKIIEK